MIDKPLAMFGVVATYHSIGHSALVLLAFLPVVLFGRRWLAAWLGWASHLVLDVVHMAVNGRLSDAGFLLWPVVVREPAVRLGPIDFFLHYLWTPAFFLEIPIWVAFGYVLWRQYGARESAMAD